MADEKASAISRLRKELADQVEPTKQLELIRLLAEDALHRPEAREICFQMLADQADNRLARLHLARLFYLDSMFDFSLRELLELKRQGVSGSLDKLIAAFGHQLTENPRPEKSATEEATVAEVDIDADFLNALEEE